MTKAQSIKKSLVTIHELTIMCGLSTDMEYRVAKTMQQLGYIGKNESVNPRKSMFVMAYTVRKCPTDKRSRHRVGILPDAVDEVKYKVMRKLGRIA